ncbi:MAG: hypothetical protein HDS22_03745 [Bacteroides sp.]|nr:hypothetical protein [Bacteroides sp.]
MIIRTFISLICIFAILPVSAYTLSSKVENALHLMSEGNLEESIRLFKTAAGTNDMAAQYYLGQCYELGIGVNTDLAIAFSMFRRAAERGFPPAMCELSRCYLSGIGVTRNIERAEEWRSRYEKKQFNLTIPNINEIFCDTAEKSNDNYYESASRIVKEPTQSTAEVSNSTNKLSSSISGKLNNDPIALESYQSLSDVDIDIPKTKQVAENVFALIIANENYQDVASVANAINDGEIMAEYCNKVLGIPPHNIHLVKDATLNNLKRSINLFSQIADAYKGEASFFVYYAGHGIPDEKTYEAYILPVDGFNSDLSTCFSLSELYKAFGEMASQKNIIIMDACFSGSTRGTEMLYSARAVKLKSKNANPIGKTVVITSAQGDETAYPYNEQNHGLFTYFLLKKLKESNGDITLKELFSYLKDNVYKQSLVINKKPQTPTVSTSVDIFEEWHNWRIN